MTPFDDWDEQKLKAWLLVALTKGSLVPAPTFSEPSIEVQIQTLSGDWHPATRERFKTAIAVALAEWSDVIHDLGLLRHLALLAGAMKASASVAQLATLVRNRLLPPDESPERMDTVDAILGVIAGFAPLPEAVTACKAFYYDPGLEPFTAITINGLMRKYPDQYPDYLPALLRLMQRRPEWFDIGPILDRVIRTITPTIFAEHVAELDDDARSILIQLLNDHPLVRASFEQDTAFGCIMISRYTKTPVMSHIGKRPGDKPAMQKMLDSMFEKEQGVESLGKLASTPVWI